MESDNPKSPLIAAQCPGLTQFADAGAEIRGFCFAGDRVFVVAGSSLKELLADGSSVSRGTLSTSSGPVSMDKNRFELVAVDRVYGYVLNLSTNAFTSITSPGFYGSELVAVSKGTAVFTKPVTDTFYTSEIDQALIYDASKFATAESSPDKIKAHIVDHEQLFLFGTEGAEVHDNTGGSADFVFTKNNGASIQVGCAAAHSLVQCDNTIFWVGTGKHGDGVVWRMNGYTPLRVSNEALEQRLQQLNIDISTARAFSIQDDGHNLYCLNMDGLDTTWVLDTKGNRWHERAELVNGEYTPWRATCHQFAFRKHLIGTASGKIYYLDHASNKYGDDVMCREIVGSHRFGASNEKIEVNKFALDCNVGDGLPTGFAGQVMFRYSKNRGRTESNWRYAPLGVVGDYRAVPAIHRLGKARDFVIRARCTDNVPFNIVGAYAS
jgi:hypothetical protein